MNIALIPVKKGDMSPICGKSLIYWTIQSVHKSEKIDLIYAIADCGEVVKELELFSFEKVRILYKQFTNKQDCLDVVMEEVEQKSSSQSHLVYIERITPLLRTKDIEAGVTLLESGNAESVSSVAGYQNQFINNGVFCMTSMVTYQKERSFKSGKVETVEMLPESLLEIHDKVDLQIMQLLMKKYGITPEVSLTEKAKQIKIFLTDCDGCLTDGGMYYTENGDELKKFNTKDGMGFSVLREKGIVTGIVTGENVEMVRRRGKKLKLDEVHCGISNKIEVVKSICEKYGCTLEQVAYVGDDINDREVLESVGISCSVANAQDEIKQIVDYVTVRKGGEGAIREVIDCFFR